MIGVFVAGMLVPAAALASQNLDPSNPNSPENDAPWVTSSFLVALNTAGGKYRTVRLQAPFADSIPHTRLSHCSRSPPTSSRTSSSRAS